MKKNGIFRLIWRIIYPILIYFTLTVIVQVIICNILAIQISHNNVGMTAEQLTYILNDKVTESAMMINVIAGIVIIPVLFIILRNDKKYVKDREEKNVKKIWYIYPCLAGMCMCIAFNWMIDRSRIIDVFPEFNEVAESLYGGKLIFEILAMVVVAPILEETLFRGIIYGRLKESINTKIAMIVSALIFGIIHGNAVQGIYAFAIGLCLAYIYEKYGHLIAAVIFHASANLVSVIMSESELVIRAISRAVIYNVMGIISLIVGIIMLILVKRHVNTDI